MSRTTPGVPFPYIDGLSKEEQRRLERDFEHLREMIPDVAPTIFDALIDPALTASDPSAHSYVNLTELIAAEDWDADYMFNVGVRQRNSPQISEPTSPLDISAKGNLSLFGLGPSVPDSTHNGWDWATLTCSATQQVFYYYLVFEPTSFGT